MTPFPTRTDEPSNHEDGCFAEECPEPNKHPVSKELLQSYPQGYMLTCTHDCPTDTHGQRHFIGRKA